MSWKMVGSPKTRKLTKTLAEEFSGMTPAPHDRPLNNTRCSVIKTAFDLGKFRTCEWASAYCEETKQTYRINGKHTSTVLASFNGAFPKDISIIVEEYICQTLEDVANLYATFDTKSSVRSVGDINHVFAAICPELTDVSGKVINLVISGISYTKWGDDYTRQPVEERARLITDNISFCLWCNDMLYGDQKKTNHIRRQAVIAAMLKTYNKSKSAATEFWTAVRDETGTKPDMADRKLAKLLITSRMISRQDAQGKKLGLREMHVKCIHAWNAWRSGEATSMAYFPKAAVPAVPVVK